MATFNGTSADDTFVGDGEVDVADGAGGADTLAGAGGGDTLAGNSGADTLYGGDGADILHSGVPAGAYTFPYDRNPWSRPVLDRGAEVDSLFGGNDNDTLYAGYGDNVDGGGGSDVLFISFQGATSGVAADFNQATTTLTIGGATISSIESADWVEGSEFNDNIIARATSRPAYNVYFGMGGDDQIKAAYYTGNMFGGDGNDTLDGRNNLSGGYLQALYGDEGDDLLYSGETSVSYGGAGADNINARYSTYGGDGNDVITMLSNYYNREVVGDAGDDQLTGSSNGESLIGGDGADTIYGGGSSGGGTDWLISGSVDSDGTPLDDMGVEVDHLFGGSADDVFYAGYGDQVDDGGASGNDRLYLSLGGATSAVTFNTSALVAGQTITLAGSAIRGIEVLSYLRGSEFADTLTLATQASQLTVNAGAGDDTVYASNSSVALSGGTGDDYFYSGTGADNFNGGAGRDTIDYSRAGAGGTVNLVTGAGTGGDQLYSVENVVGSGFDDLIVASTDNNRLDGGAGSDTVSYASAINSVTVDLALTTAQEAGGSGTDTLISIENVIGSAFNDVISGNAGDNAMNAGQGIDTLTYANASAGVTVNLLLTTAQATGGSGTDTLSNFEILIGSTFNDTLTGDGANNSLFGGAGDDGLVGGGGDDTLTGGTGADLLDGGAGIDRANYRNAASGVTVSLALTGPQDTGGAGIDTLIGIEYLLGSEYSDVLIGNDADNNMVGYGGDNVFIGGLGVNQLIGDVGNDTASYSTASSAVTVSLAVYGVQNTGGAGQDVLGSIENLIGSSFNDTLTGDGGNNILTGLAGNDLLLGGAGNDTLDGGAGVDTASYATATSAVGIGLHNNGARDTGGAGIDTLISIENLIGSEYGDTLGGDDGANSLYGGAGDDRLDGRAGSNLLDGGSGIDTALYVTAGGAVTVDLSLSGSQNTGGAGTDTLVSIEVVLGSAFGDTITGDSGANSLYGLDGDDILQGGGGDDRLDGANGIDTASYSRATAAVNLTLTQSIAQNTSGAGFDTLISIENLTGSAFNDTLTGDGGANVLRGLAGDDLLAGGAGDDTLDGGSGVDTAVYIGAASAVTVNLALTTAQNTVGAGIDTLGSIENLTGSAFNDVLTGNGGANILTGLAGDDLLDGGAGNDILYGGAGIDTASYATAASAVSVSLGTATPQDTVGAGGDIIAADIENLTGSAFNDFLAGNGGANAISGLAGNDVLDGGAGNDTLDGGVGTDTTTYASAASSVTVNLALTTAQNTAGAGTDTLTSIENLVGSAFGDTLTGDDSANVLNGGDGDDVLEGRGGDNGLYGGAGRDTASYATGPRGVMVSLKAIGPQYIDGLHLDHLVSIESLVGSAFTDNLTGDDGDNSLYGGNGDDALAGGLGDDQLFGGAGNDQAVYTDAASGITVNLTIAGPQNTGGAGTDALTSIEDLVGSVFGDVMIGDSAANFFQGGGGDDLLEGGDGNDRLWGGVGSDTATFVSAASAVTVNLAVTTAQDTVGAGTDTLQTIENLTGSVFNDTLTGDGDANVLTGGLGNDALDGGGGTDTAVFSGARSAYTVLTNGTTVTVTGPDGTDTLSNIEQLRFSDQTLLVANLIPSGGTGSDALTGTTGDDTLDGGAGDDVLNGGAGNDLLYGGSGNDTYMVNSQGDLTFEDAGGGTDTVVASVDIYLYPNIENLTLAAGAGSIFGVGNSSDNVITGNEGDNLLIAGGGNDTASGGAGADRLFGEDGNDTLNGDAGTDYLVAGTGDDAVYGGAGADSLYGEDGNDSLYGGSDNAVDLMVAGVGDDSLHGDSGQGEGDLMDGGSGNDTYYVDAAGDLTFEAVGGGTDLVIADIAGGGYYLWAHTENLTLAGTTLYGVGNELDNVLTGNAGVNWLLGGAGNDTLNGKAGNDVLFGEAGSDTFVFERGTGGDVIGDFQTGTDKIKLTGLGFADFAAVKANMHQVGADTAIDLGQGELVVILGVGVNAFTAGDFVLG